MLEGKTVNLRVIEREDLALFAKYWNDPEFWGEHTPFPAQFSRADAEKDFESSLSSHDESKVFVIEKKEGKRIGNVSFYTSWGGGMKLLEIGYLIVPSERGKGYCSEAVQIMLDYLFLSKDTVRVQAHTNVKNMASQKVLEKTDFKKEGILRKTAFIRGEWRDRYIYSILREEWKEPKILTKTEKK